MYVHICTRQVLGTEISVNVFWERKGLLDRLSLYISNCTDQEKKKKKKNRMDR